jgi:hypothetical protein
LFESNDRKRVLEPLYHYSDSLFDKFSIGKASSSAIWGAGIYLSDHREGLEGWSKSRDKKGYLYTIAVEVDSDRVIDITQPTSDLVFNKIEAAIGRSLAPSTKESGLFPLLTIERKFGGLIDGMRVMGFDVFIHSPPGNYQGKHYLIINTDLITIKNIEQI